MVCGAIGYALGFAIAQALAVADGLAWPVCVAIALVPPAVLVAGARVSARLAGRQRLVFYELALAATLATTLIGAAGGAPCRIVLDIVAIGIGAFLVCGRFGCFAVGCCHGTPARRGVRYGDAHVELGLDPALRGVPLVPVQLLDAGNAALATAVALAVHAAATPGHAAAAWFTLYGAGRFALELVRGDPRPRLLGSSEPQWTAAATTWIALALWPCTTITVAAAAQLAALVAVALAWRARWPRRYWLAQPEHLHELHRFVARARYRPGRERIVTRGGIEASVHAMPDGAIDLVTRYRGTDLRDLDPVIAYLSRRWHLLDVVVGQTRGVVHLLLR